MLPFSVRADPGRRANRFARPPIRQPAKRIKFPKPGKTQATRKVSYLLAAQGTPYVVGAGIYDEKAKVEDLERLTGGQQ